MGSRGKTNDAGNFAIDLRAVIGRDFLDDLLEPVLDTEALMRAIRSLPQRQLHLEVNRITGRLREKLQHTESGDLLDYLRSRFDPGTSALEAIGGDARRIGDDMRSFISDDSSEQENEDSKTGD